MEALITDPQAASLAERLVRAMGRVEQMDALYAEDARLHLPASLTDGHRVVQGRAALLAFNQATFGERFEPGVEVDLLDVVGGGELSAARVLFKAVVRSTGERYENEYTFFVHGRGGLIGEVYEGIDTLALSRALRLP